MKLRKNLLIELLKHETVSGNEAIIIPELTEELIKLGFDVDIDDIGNISAVRGKANAYPLLNAHMDIVDYAPNYFGWNKSYGKTSLYDDFAVDYYTSAYSYDEVVGYMTEEELQIYFECDDCSNRFTCPCKSDFSLPCESFELSPLKTHKVEQYCEDMGLALDDICATSTKKSETKTKNKKFVIKEEKGKIKGSGGRVLGGDDKCGIFITLELARLLKDQPLKILFTVSEEVGCVGVTHFIKNNPTWFNDVAYCITIDRRYGDNLLWKQCGKQSCTKEFASKLAMKGIECGIPIKMEDGSVADVIYIRNLVKDSVNVSAGYYNPHDEDEYIVWDEVVLITKWLRKFISWYIPKVG